MNPLLRIYGGHSKTASEGGDVEELDLNTLSAAELIEGINNGSISLDNGEAEEEKVAESEEIDPSKLTARELLELYAQEEEAQEKVAEDALLAQMQSDGSYEYWDMAGRIQAQALHDQLSKLASAEEDLGDEIEVDLDQLSGQDLIALQEAGYEFLDDAPAEEEKVAKSMPAFLRKGMRKADKGLQAVGEAVDRRIKGVTRPGSPYDKGSKGRMRRIGATALGTGAAVAGGTAAGIKRMMRRKKDD